MRKIGLLFSAPLCIAVLVCTPKQCECQELLQGKPIDRIEAVKETPAVKSSWVLLRNTQVLQAQVQSQGERTTLLVDGGKVELATKDIEYHSDKFNDIIKFRLAGLDANNLAAQVGFIEWALRYESFDAARLQLNDLMSKYPKSARLETLQRRLSSLELMKQQKNTITKQGDPLPDAVKQATFAPVAPMPKPLSASQKKLSTNRMTRASNRTAGVESKSNVPNAANGPIESVPVAQQPISNVQQPMLIAPQPISNAQQPMSISQQPISSVPQPMPSSNLAAQQKPGSQTSVPMPTVVPSSSDPYDPDAFNRAHSTSGPSTEPLTPLGKKVVR